MIDFSKDPDFSLTYMAAKEKGVLGKFYLKAFAEFPKNEGHYPDLMMDLSGAADDGVLDDTLSVSIGEFNRCYPNSRFTAAQEAFANDMLDNAIKYLIRKLSLSPQG